MCGIAGYVGEFSPDLLGRMRARIVHRGPDGDGEEVLDGGRVGFAHTRLSILDVTENAAQPMWDASHTVCMTYNGEIYNFPELRDGLLAEGVTLRSTGDSEVLLNLYMRDGPDALKQLNGMFAVAIWDSRTKKTLIARDGFGVKPLYIATTPKGLVFASEIKAVLEEGSVDRSIDMRAIQSYMTYMYCPAPRTPLKAVRKVHPGEALLVDRDGSIERRWQFYDLPYDQPIDAGMSEADAVDQVRATFETAVQRQMIADVPVGAFLSGGLDSSAIVSVARHHSAQQPMKTFTIRSDSALDKKEGRVTDLPYARKTAKALGVELLEVEVQPNMLSDLGMMLYHLDEPQADFASLNTFYIAELAREHGMKVLLSGIGGDDFFAGYRRHFALMQERYWSWWPSPLRKAAKGAVNKLPTSNLLARRARKALMNADKTPDERLIGYFHWIEEERSRALFTAEAQAELDGWSVSDPFRKTLEGFKGDGPALNKMLYLEAKHFMSDHNLNYGDKMTMAAGVEGRVPFCDPDLVSLAARLPLKWKLNGRETKSVLKKAMVGTLPQDVIYRPKTGFGVPMRSWILGEMKELLDDVLSPESLRKRGLFDPEAVRVLMEQNQLRRIDVSYPIFSMACIELWCRIFIDGEMPEISRTAPAPVAVPA